MNYLTVQAVGGINLVHPNASIVGKMLAGNRTLSGDMTDTAAYTKGLEQWHVAFVDVPIRRSGDGPFKAKFQGMVAVPEWQWWIATGLFYDELNAAYWQMACWLIVVTAIIFAIVTLMA